MTFKTIGTIKCQILFLNGRQRIFNVVPDEYIPTENSWNFGMLLFSFLVISILVDSKLLKDSQETIGVAIIVGRIIIIVIGLISFWKFVKSQ